VTSLRLTRTLCGHCDHVTMLWSDRALSSRKWLCKCGTENVADLETGMSRELTWRGRTIETSPTLVRHLRRNVAIWLRKLAKRIDVGFGGAADE